MNEVEKMYENARCELGCCKYAKYGYEGEEGIWYYCEKEGRECWTYPNGDADCVEKGYPPFTAEKQLELIKWLAIHKSSYGLQYFGKQWANCCEFEWENFEECSEDAEFEQSLSGLINILWQDLTEEERKQIKNILESEVREWVI